MPESGNQNREGSVKNESEIARDSSAATIGEPSIGSCGSDCGACDSGSASAAPDAEG